MEGQLKVNISINDGDTLGGVNINTGMSLDVGNIVQTGTQSIAPGEGWMPIGWSSGTSDPPYNEKGAFILVKNNGTTGWINVDSYATCNEPGGDAMHTVQRLYPHEFTWLNVAGPEASQTTVPRAIKLVNTTNIAVTVDYAVFSRV